VAIRSAAARVGFVPRGRVVHRARRAREDHLRWQTVRVRRILDLLGYHVALFALERAAIGPAAQVNLVRAHADRRDVRVRQRVERWGRVLVTAVADLAVTGLVIDDAVDVPFGRNEMSLGVDDCCVAGVAAVGLRVRRLRWQAVTGAAGLATGARFCPDRPGFPVAVAALAGARGRVVGWFEIARLGQAAEGHVPGRSVIGVAR